MTHPRGKPLTPEEKRLLVSLNQYFERNRFEFRSTDSPAQMTSDALELGLATVYRVMAQYRKDPTCLDALPQMRGRPSYSIESSDQEAVRAYIRQANREGVHMTLETLQAFLESKSPHRTYHLSTLARTLDRWGFEFGRGIRTQHLKEKDYIVSARQRYLRNMRGNRNSDGQPIRAEVYLDESYVNKNHSNDLIWYSVEDGPWVQKPTGKGERLIILNAITMNGWVPNAKVVFKSNKKTGDYHGQMDGELFRKWFTESLLPNIPNESIIVMDNAPYHNLLTEDSAPTPTCSKQRIRDWLDQNKIPCATDCLKVELVEILKKIAPEPTYEVDVIAKKRGHKILRTPPYHPELQPIEKCWAVVKNEVSRHCDFSLENLKIQLDMAFDKVTANTCKKIIKKIRSVEDKFWQEDTEFDRKQEKISV